ncbi:putative L-cysteine desulfhydrase, chloroplastic [Sesamum angolense]|uniref:L-cysteine desulfhydrase, chloroplastic n=1 Tax=Sesamum angolense TaxID=2727404 RepID=A0AAE1WYM1_9LAMI|nr:putative L-cysteine desulfhydrase, chloroplastic [Sesamum angolense]
MSLINGTSSTATPTAQYPDSKPKPITPWELRTEFSHHDPTIARINNGSFGCCPATIMAAQQRYQLLYLRQPDYFYFYTLKPSILRTRRLIQTLINADNADEVSIVDNATTAAAIVLQHTTWSFFSSLFQAGDAVLILHYAYGAVKKSVRAYISRAGGHVIEVHLPFPVKSSSEIVCEFQKALQMGKANGRKIRLAVIDHITSMPSVIIPVKELVRMCRDEGVDRIFIDGAHAIGNVEIDVKDIGADFYTNLHHPVVSHEYGNGLAIESSWTGTRDYSPQLVLPEVMEFVSRFDGGIEGIMRRNHETVVEMAQMLVEAWGTELGAPPEMCSSMAMGASGGEVDPITGYARISHQVYNVVEDYYRLRDAVNKNNQLKSLGEKCKEYCGQFLMVGRGMDRIKTSISSEGRNKSSKKVEQSFQEREWTEVKLSASEKPSTLKETVSSEVKTGNPAHDYDLLCSLHLIRFYCGHILGVLNTIFNQKLLFYHLTPALKSVLYDALTFSSDDLSQRSAEGDDFDIGNNLQSFYHFNHVIVVFRVCRALDGYYLSVLMAEKKVIVICQSGGKFETSTDGILSYEGGDAHAMEVDNKMKFKDFKLEVAEMFNCNLATMSIKYFLPGNKKTLISISNDKDLKRMIKFHSDSDTAEVYVVTEEIVAPEASYMPGSRSSRTSLSEAAVPLNASQTMMNNAVDDISEPGLLLDATFDMVSDTNHDEAQTDVPTEISVPTEMPMPISFVGSYSEKHAKVAEKWQDNITGVGQRFNSVHEFREALRKYAIAHQFAFKYKKNDSDRVTVKCKSEGCPWRIHASRLSTTPLICIKKMNPTHTCEGSMGTNGYKATRSWVASIIKEKLSVFPNYKPKDIVNDIKQEYGIQLNYFQAWRGKEIAKEQLQGSYKEAYSQLPFFWSLLAATAADGDDGFFPVAFAVVDTESDENWRWFLQQLKTALSNCHGLTFVADREKGLRESIAGIFQNEDVHHGFCLRYLSEQFHRDLKGKFSHEVKRLMVEDFFSAAHAPTPEGFHRCVESIKNISVQAHNWIMQSEPVHWANAFFQGARYNHMTSNFGELLQLESIDWLRRLTPSMEDRLEKESAKVSTLQVLISAGNRFEVRGETVEVVDVDNCDCSCKGWQLTGLPCSHAIAVIGCLGRDPHDYCSRYFTTESYRTTYSQSVHPMSNVNGSLQKGTSQLAVTVTPPPTRRPPGRPTTKKTGSQDVGKRQFLCSRCKVLESSKALTLSWKELDFPMKSRVMTIPHVRFTHLDHRLAWLPLAAETCLLTLSLAYNADWDCDCWYPIGQQQLAHLFLILMQA